MYSCDHLANHTYSGTPMCIVCAHTCIPVITLPITHTQAHPSGTPLCVHTHVFLSAPCQSHILRHTLVCAHTCIPVSTLPITHTQAHPCVCTHMYSCDHLAIHTYTGTPMCMHTHVFL
eukprot:TRINITY_DN11808_c0_g1_i3.p1 TRINITY_DN11808_c0_g1~~TRINITY_DN11808_c0_g1_i3.p1  ORF type:complete len:118 (+),score=5.60 TRINITY_DN11808_c0_g1_i3:2-355(+)